MRYDDAMDALRWTWVGVLAGAVAAAIGFWLTFPDSGSLAPEPLPPSPEGQAAQRVPDRPARAKPPPRPNPAQRRAKQSARKSAPARSRGSRGAEGEVREVPPEVVEAIEEHRAENVAKSEAKILAYAEYAGWSDATTDEVMRLIGTAHDDVDRLLGQVTDGQRPWHEVKTEVRDVRMAQAKAIRDELGDEAFRDFAHALKKTGGRRAARSQRPRRGRR